MNEAIHASRHGVRDAVHNGIELEIEREILACIGHHVSRQVMHAVTNGVWRFVHDTLQKSDFQ